MTATKRGFLFLLALSLAASILLPAQMASAQTKPPAPQFTIKLVNNTFDLPALYSIDPFTGQQTVENGGHWEWRTIDITIKNQRYAGNSSGSYNSYTGIMYRIYFKGAYSDQWRNVTASSSAGPSLFPQNSREDYTTISLSLNNGVDINSITSARRNVDFPASERPNGGVTITEGGSADFKVQALSGTSQKNPVIPFSGYSFCGQTSEWSDIKTINLADPSANTQTFTDGSDQSAITPTLTPEQQTISTPEPTTTPKAALTNEQTQLSFQIQIDALRLDWQSIIIVALVVVALLTGVVLVQRRNGIKKTRS